MQEALREPRRARRMQILMTRHRTANIHTIDQPTRAALRLHRASQRSEHALKRAPRRKRINDPRTRNWWHGCRPPRSWTWQQASYAGGVSRRPPPRRPPARCLRTPQPSCSGNSRNQGGRRCWTGVIGGSAARQLGRGWAGSSAGAGAISRREIGGPEGHLQNRQQANSVIGENDGVREAPEA